MNNTFKTIVIVLFLFSCILTCNSVFAVDVTTSDVINASDNVVSHVEDMHALPGSVNIKNMSMSTPSFLKASVQTVLNIENETYTTPTRDFKGPSNPHTDVSCGILNSTEYLGMARNINNYMDKQGQAPNYTSSSLGEIRYESLVYLYSQILNNYKTDNTLPDFIVIDSWNTISNKNGKFYDKQVVLESAKNVKSYIETHHALPGYVSIKGVRVSMPSFLRILSTQILNIYGNSHSKIPLVSYEKAYRPSGSPDPIKLDQEEYIHIASHVQTFLCDKEQAPNTAITHDHKISFDALIYTFSEILDYYQFTGDLPKEIIVMPLSVITNPQTSFFTAEDITSSSSKLKKYVESNHALPSTVKVGDKELTLQPFLYLMILQTLNYNKGLKSTKLFYAPYNNFNKKFDTTEDIISGEIPLQEYIELSHNLKKYMDTDSTEHTFSSSLGNQISFQSLIYLYTQILSAYSIELPSNVVFHPWIVNAHPGQIYNYRTTTSYNSLQEAINDSNTINGDIIGLGKENIQGNIIINKSMFIYPVMGFNVTITPKDVYSPVFTISGGEGSVLQNLIIKGSTYSSGVYITNSSYNKLLNNVISENKDGVVFCDALNNQVQENNITKNFNNGLNLINSSQNQIINNKITLNNLNGILVNNTFDNILLYNFIQNNNNGVDSFNSSNIVQLNVITDNNRYGFHSEDKTVTQLDNNYWGSNTPQIVDQESQENSLICKIWGCAVEKADIYLKYGTVKTWLPLKLTISPDNSNHNPSNHNLFIKAILTHNNHDEKVLSNKKFLSSSVFDGMPLNFIADNGKIESNVFMINGEAITILQDIKEEGVVKAVLGGHEVSLNFKPLSSNISRVFNMRTQKEFSSIKDAIDDETTLDGDIILLGEGAFTENIIIHKKLTIQPLKDNNVIIQPKNSASASIIVLSDDVTIKNLKIEPNLESNKNNNNLDMGIHGINIKNLQILNNSITGYTTGLLLLDSTNITVIGNTFVDNGQSVFLNSVNQFLMKDNNIKDTLLGLHISDTATSTFVGNNLSQVLQGVNLKLSENITFYENKLIETFLGFYIDGTLNTTISKNIFKDTSVGILYTPHNTAKIEDNVCDCLINDSVVDMDNVVMQNNPWNCGASSLATLLKIKGVNFDLEDLTRIVGADKFGASMYGLIQAANTKGLYLTGVNKPLNQVKSQEILLLNINNAYHFTVVRNVTNTTVSLADPVFGNINFDLETLDKYYTEHALTSHPHTPQSTILTHEETKKIKGTVIPFIIAGIVAVIEGMTVSELIAVGGVITAGVILETQKQKPHAHMQNPIKYYYHGVYPTVYSPYNTKRIPTRHYPQPRKTPKKPLKQPLKPNLSSRSPKPVLVYGEAQLASYYDKMRKEDQKINTKHQPPEETKHQNKLVDEYKEAMRVLGGIGKGPDCKGKTQAECFTKHGTAKIMEYVTKIRMEDLSRVEKAKYIAKIVFIGGMITALILNTIPRASPGMSSEQNKVSNNTKNYEKIEKNITIKPYTRNRVIQPDKKHSNNLKGVQIEL